MKELKSYLRLWIPFFLFSNVVWAYVFWEWYPGSWTQPSRMVLCASVSIIATIIIGFYSSNKPVQEDRELKIIEAQRRYIEMKTENKFLKEQIKELKENQTAQHSVNQERDKL